MSKDNINPSYYIGSKIQLADIIDEFNLDWYQASILKYVIRCKHKGKKMEDLQKAKWYLERYILKNGH